MENKLKRLLQGMKSGEKLPKKNQLLILLLTGILLLVIVVPFPEDSQDAGTEANVSASAGSTGTISTPPAPRR